MKLRVLALLLIAVASVLAQTGARYLIITYDNYYDALAPLVEWKNKKGMLCVIKKTSEVGVSNSSIRSYVQNAYNNWNPRPEFLLLVGCGAQINAFRRGWGSAVIETDNCFGDLSGDYRVELPYGRFPCKTVRECSVMVAKTLEYERTPDLSDTTWYLRGTCIVNDSADSDAPTYWSDVRTASALAAANGYTAIDTLASLRQGNAARVAQSVDSGTSFVLYRGGATDYWHVPFDMRPYLGGLTNHNRLPIVYSFTCHTVDLDPMNDSMTGNTWIRVGAPQNLYGAVAVVGNTHGAMHVAGQRSAMTRGYFTGVMSESLLNLGRAVLRGKLQLYNEYQDSMDYMGFTLLGDPELNIWTGVPQPLTVAYDAQIPLDSQNFTVRVFKDGAVPVANALVCIRSSSGIYQYNYTLVDGSITFAICPLVPETMDVTVTARNCEPHEGRVEIFTPSAVAESRPASVVTPGNDVLTVAPNPGRSRFNITSAPGSTIRIYTSTGRLVQTIINPQSDLAPRPSPLGWDASRMPAGVYVVKAVRANDRPQVRMLQIVK